MQQYLIRKYTSADYSIWNDFINQAKNATFLFHRDFMEYHHDRFEDYSLIVEDEKGWLAVLPANRVGEEVFSHQGLTYGGLVFKGDLKLEKVLLIFKSILQQLHISEIKTLHIKELPFIYSDYFSDELKYALFLAEAKLSRRDTLAVIDLSKEIKPASGRMEGVKRGIKNELIIKEETDLLKKEYGIELKISKIISMTISIIPKNKRYNWYSLFSELLVVLFFKKSFLIYTKT